jgi:hypothetical protein
MAETIVIISDDSSYSSVNLRYLIRAIRRRCVYQITPRGGATGNGSRSVTQGAKFAEVWQQDCERRDRQATITDMKRCSSRRNSFDWR